MIVHTELVTAGSNRAQLDGTPASHRMRHELRSWRGRPLAERKVSTAFTFREHVLRTGVGKIRTSPSKETLQ